MTTSKQAFPVPESFQLKHVKSGDPIFRPHPNRPKEKNSAETTEAPDPSPTLS